MPKYKVITTRFYTHNLRYQLTIQLPTTVGTIKDRPRIYITATNLLPTIQY